MKHSFTLIELLVEDDIIAKILRIYKIYCFFQFFL